MYRHRTPVFFVGTRPEAIKLGPVIAAYCALADHDPRVLCTGQHAPALVRGILVDLGVPEDLVCDSDGIEPSDLTPDIVHNLARMVDAISTDRLLTRDDTDYVVQGDTTSALAAALVGRLRGARVHHVEAGLRSNGPTPHPEETHRRTIAALAAVHYAPSAAAAEHLTHERVQGQIVLTGQTGYDAIDLVRANAESGWSSDHFVGPGSLFALVALHRRDDRDGRLDRLACAITHLSRQGVVPVVLAHGSAPVDPAWAAALGTRHTKPIVIPGGLHYRAVHALLASQRCIAVVTDSGGLHEEAAYFGVPTISVRKHSERANLRLTTMAWQPEEVARALGAIELAPGHRIRFAGVFSSPSATATASQIVAAHVNSYAIRP